MIASSILKAVDADWHKILDPLLMGQVYSQIIWFPMWFVMPFGLGFWSLWNAEKNGLKVAEVEAKE